jgi:hypothetical protein
MGIREDKREDKFNEKALCYSSQMDPPMLTL